MADVKDLYVRLANGSEHRINVGDDSPTELAREIVLGLNRPEPDGDDGYEWIELDDGSLARVEAIDVLWLVDADGEKVRVFEAISES